MNQIGRWSFIDWLIMGAAALGVVIPTILIFNFSWISEELSASGKPSIGRLQYFDKDTRMRPSDSLTWFEVKKNQPIHSGDAIFCGDGSAAQVTLREGSSITIGEKSIIYFRDINKKKFIDIEQGNFRIKVKGKINVAMGGSITSLEGSESDVQIATRPNKEKIIKLIKGKARIVSADSKALDLNEETVVQIDQMGQATRLASNPAISDTLVSSETPLLNSTPEPLIHIWHLHDIYKIESNHELRERESPHLIPASMTLNWLTGKTSAQKLIIEVASTEDFQNPLRYTSDTRKSVVEKVFNGNNFIRGSHDGTVFSQPVKFIARAEFLADAKPLAVADALEVPIIDQQASVGITLTSPIAELGFVIQSSTVANFTKSKTIWSPGTRLTPNFSEPGHYFTVSAP